MTSNDNLLGSRDSSQNEPENSGFPVFIRDAETNEVIYVNNFALDLLKVTPGQILNQDFSQILKTYFQPLSPGMLLFNHTLFLVRKERVQLYGRDLDWMMLRAATTGFDEHSRQFLQKMAEVLVHRLRSPLTGIMGFTGLIEQSQNNEKYVQKVQAGLNHLARALDRVEELSRQIVPQKNRFKLRQLIDDLLKDLPGGHQKNILVDAADMDETVEADFVLLKSILSELLKNALEHVPNGEIRIEIPSGKTFRVMNPGTPIPAELSSKIFSPFFSMKAQSMGLGLTISRLQAEAVGATLRLTANSQEEGIAFELDLGQRVQV